MSFLNTYAHVDTESLHCDRMSNHVERDAWESTAIASFDEFMGLLLGPAPAAEAYDALAPTLMVYLEEFVFFRDD